MHVLMHDFLNQTHAACQHMHVNAGSLGGGKPLCTPTLFILSFSPFPILRSIPLAGSMERERETVCIT